MAKILNPAVFYTPLARAIGKILAKQDVYPSYIDFPEELAVAFSQILLKKSKKDVPIIFHQQKRAKKYLLNLIYETFQKENPGSSMLLITHKRSGGKSIGKRILDEGLSQSVETLFTGFQGYRLLHLIRPITLPDPSSFSLEKTIEVFLPKLDKPVQFVTHQELFSSDHLDEGSKTLINNIDYSHFKNILDLGCGWGAVGSLALLINKNAKATMVDIDPLALKYAQKNIDNLKLQTRARVLRSDDLRLLAGSSKFDLLVSYPPFHLSNVELRSLFERIRLYLEKSAQIVLCVDKTYQKKFEKLLTDVFKSTPSSAQIGQYFLLKTKNK